jgi:hypothetical protein
MSETSEKKLEPRHSLTVKLGRSWNNIRPNLFAVFKGDILSRNSPKGCHGTLLDTHPLELKTEISQGSFWSGR